jgi:hypothetical protein
MDWDFDWYFDHPWTLVVAFACLASPAAFFIGWRARRLSAAYRRLLLALSAVLAFGAVFPVALLGLLYVGYAGYCDDGGDCDAPYLAPIGIGLAFLGLAAVLLCVSVLSVKTYRELP